VFQLLRGLVWLRSENFLLAEVVSVKVMLLEGVIYRYGVDRGAVVARKVDPVYQWVSERQIW
jgi:hypothetical protein